jgi:PBP1b-binding outer membrane lipoprotein LpoB
MEYMRKLTAIIALAFLMASCSSSRCGCPTWGYSPDHSDDVTVLTDMTAIDQPFVWQ